MLKKAIIATAIILSANTLFASSIENSGNSNVDFHNKISIEELYKIISNHKSGLNLETGDRLTELFTSFTTDGKDIEAYGLPTYSLDQNHSNFFYNSGAVLTHIVTKNKKILIQLITSPYRAVNANFGNKVSFDSNKKLLKILASSIIVSENDETKVEKVVFVNYRLNKSDKWEVVGFEDFMKQTYKRNNIYRIFGEFSPEI